MNDDQPKTNGYNDIDLRRWRDYPDIWTDSLWMIPSRERGNGHQLDYHGNFIPQIARQILLRFSRSGDIVLDMFLGSGTTAIEALNQKRRCVGVELKPEMVEYVRGKLPADALDDQVRLIQGDSTSAETAEHIRAALDALGAEFAQLLVLHPPYHDIIVFSEQTEDLSNAPSTEAFLEGFSTVAQRGYALLEPGRFAALVIGDKYSQGRLIPLGFLCMQQMESVGFVPKSIVVKNIEGNEVTKGRRNNLWRYRALKHGLFLFKHEYLFVFQKPKADPARG